MTKSFCFLFLWYLTLAANAQTNPPRLIVRGDDMGYSHSGNLALMKCYKEGVQTSIEVIVPSPWFPEAVKMLNENPKADVGIHLAITSEWDNIKWRPLTDCRSLKDGDGYFWPMIYPNKNYPKRSVIENDGQLADIEKEFRAQIEMALKKIPHISHLSSHMGCTGITEEVKALTRKLAAEYKIPVHPEPKVDGYVSYEGPRKTSQDKITSFIKMLDKLEPGKTYIFVDHPGLNDAELQAISHIGYENVAEDRQGVTDLFTNEKVKTAIKEKGIKLISYNDLAEYKN